MTLMVVVVGMVHPRAGMESNLVHKFPGQDVFHVGGLDSRCWETIPRHDRAVVSEEAL